MLGHIFAEGVEGELRNLINGWIENAREEAPSEEELLIVEPYEAGKIIWGEWVFYGYAARYGTGKTFTGYYLYHHSRQHRDCYVTYVNIRDIPETQRRFPYLSKYFDELNVNRTNTIADLVIPLLVDPIGVKRYVGVRIKTTLPKELSEEGRKLIKQKHLEVALKEFGGLDTLDKSHILILDELELAIISREQFMQLAELAKLIREQIYDKVGSKLKVVLLMPEFHLKLDCIGIIERVFREHEWRHVIGVSILSKLRAFDRDKLKQLAVKTLNKLQLNDVDGNSPIPNDVLETICSRAEVYGTTRTSVRALVNVLAKSIAESIEKNFGVTNVNLNILREKLQSGGVKWRQFVERELIDEIFRDVPERVVYDGEYSLLGRKWLQILERFASDLAGSDYRYSLLKKKPGFYSYELWDRVENRGWILWLRTSDIRRPEKLINIFPELSSEVSEKRKRKVVCLHPIDVRVHKLVEYYPGVETVPLHKDELIALLFNAGEPVTDGVFARMVYSDLKERVLTILGEL